jgi:hypothetical protein
VGRAVLAPGIEAAFDDCCEGQVWVRLVQLAPVTTLQTRKASGHHCAVDTWNVTVEIGVVRCAAVVDDEGNAPTPPEITADADQVIADMESLMAAIQCCMEPTDFVRWEPQGVLGGCAGGKWTVVTRVAGCRCA